MNKPPNKGDTVMIHEDPYTQTREEGLARVLSIDAMDQISAAVTEYTLTVRFSGDSGRYQRRYVVGI